MSVRPIPLPQKANPKVTRKIGTYGTSEQCMIQMNCRGKEGNGTLSLGYTIVNVYRWTCQGRSEPKLEKPSSFPVDLTTTTGIVKSKCLCEWTPISDRIITARLWSTYVTRTIVQIYAHANDAMIEDKDNIFKQRHHTSYRKH